MKQFVYVFILLLLQSRVALAQTNTEKKKDLTNGTVAQQLEYVEQESNNFQEYKVIKKTWYNQLQGNINDSVAKQKETTKSIQEQLAAELKSKTGIQAELSATQDTLAQVREIQSNMRWVGIPMEKTSYRIIMWGLVIVLSVLALLAFVRFKASNTKTKQAKADLEAVQQEFEESKKAALLREQKLRRELQDEINERRKREGK